MAAPSPIPVLLCSKGPAYVEAIREKVKPEFEIIKACPNPKDAHASISALGAGPATIDGVDYPKPKAVLMGACFSDDEFRSIYDGVEMAKSVPWIRRYAAKAAGGDQPPVTPPPPVIASTMRKALDDHVEGIRDGTAAGELWLVTE